MAMPICHPNNKIAAMMTQTQDAQRMTADVPLSTMTATANGLQILLNALTEMLGVTKMMKKKMAVDKNEDSSAAVDVILAEIVLKIIKAISYDSFLVINLTNQHWSQR